MHPSHGTAKTLPYVIHTPIGCLGLIANDHALTHVLFVGAAQHPGTEPAPSSATPLLRQAEIELHDYFSGSRTAFSVPLAPQGTPFQRAVWAALQTIPYGATISYKELGARIGKPQASRAVGGANNKNPIAVLIPCHRVIGANGRLVGYGGGLSIKEHLLDLEARNSRPAQ